MSNAKKSTRADGKEANTPAQAPPTALPVPPPHELDDAAPQPSVTQAGVPTQTPAQDPPSESDDGATPKPTNAAIAPTDQHAAEAAPATTQGVYNHARSLSPTTSEFDQAGFFPAAGDSTRKHTLPGTPSDKQREAERREARASAMRSKEGPAPSATARGKMKGSRVEAEEDVPLTGGSIIKPYTFPAFNPAASAHSGYLRESAQPSSAPATAVRATRTDTAHANQAGSAPTNASGQRARAPSPHFGRFTRSTSGSFTLSRLNEMKKGGLPRPPHATGQAKGLRGPSPSRAESSARGAARRVTSEDLRPVKQEPASPFTLPPVAPAYYDSEEDFYLSPSEEAVLRELQRKRTAARAAQRRRDYEMHGVVEVPPPPHPPAPASDAMPISSDSDTDSDAEGLPELINGGVAINNPQPGEDELAATRALHPALANSTIGVTTAGTRGPADGLPRNHYWTNACPAQRQAIQRARGFKALLRALGIIGHPEVGPNDPAMLAFCNKTLREIFGEDTRALATRITAPVGAKRGDEVAPGTFAITGMTAEEADFLKSVQWLLAGAFQGEVHDVDEAASDHIYNASGAMVSKSRFRRELTKLWSADTSIRGIAAAHAAQKGIDEDEAFNLIIQSLDIEVADVILPRSPGVVTRQFIVNGGAFLSTELHRRLREAASALIYDSQLRGRAEAWTGWHCMVCNSVSHPTGMCPSRVLAGWAAAADELLRRLKAKKDQRNGDTQGPPRFDDNRRGGPGGGRGGRGGSAQGGLRGRAL